MKRLSAPDRTREELRALISGDLGTATGRSDLVRLALRLIVEEALEGEVADAVGRERYERAEGAAAGYRNGYRPGKIKTAEGMVEYAAPQVQDTPEPFVSAIRPPWRPDRGAGAAGGRALCARAVDARHRGCLHRRGRPAAVVAGENRTLSVNPASGLHAPGHRVSPAPSRLASAGDTRPHNPGVPPAPDT